MWWAIVLVLFVVATAREVGAKRQSNRWGASPDFLFSRWASPPLSSKFYELTNDDPDLNAFSNDINQCLFRAWRTDFGVLAQDVQCTGSQLCYGSSPAVAQFASCYNTQTLTPDFTGNLVKEKGGKGGRAEWHNEEGKFKPDPQSDVKVDYDVSYKLQNHLFPNYDQSKNQYLARGHLTARSDFTSEEEQEMTMINTNIAPQWQKFNEGSWATLEQAVVNYANQAKLTVYVFTGVGGNAVNPDTRAPIGKLNDRVVVPRYYWKAVCAPGVGSIVYVAENPVGYIGGERREGCLGIPQCHKTGVVDCYSLDDARSKAEFNDFKLPFFDQNNCKPDQLGDFMKSQLQKLKQKRC